MGRGGCVRFVVISIAVLAIVILTAVLVICIIGVLALLGTVVAVAIIVLTLLGLWWMARHDGQLLRSNVQSGGRMSISCLVGHGYETQGGSDVAYLKQWALGATDGWFCVPHSRE